MLNRYTGFAKWPLLLCLTACGQVVKIKVPQPGSDLTAGVLRGGDERPEGYVVRLLAGPERQLIDLARTRVRRCDGQTESFAIGFELGLTIHDDA